MTKRPHDRTDFGARLLLAREHAGMSQKELAEAVGMAQSTLSGAERNGSGSAKTTQIAAATKVDATWLATGKGNMLPTNRSHAVEEKRPPDWFPAAPAPTPLPPSQNIYQVIITLGELLSGHGDLARLAVGPLLRRLAEHPDEAESIARQIQRNLTGNTTAPASSPSPSGQIEAGAPLGKRINQKA